MKRCEWASTNETLQYYHDTEWGIPSHDDRYLFEILCLEGFQSGLSWLTVLNKRPAFKKAFANFEVKKIVKFTPSQKTSLMKNGDIIRNRLKIGAVINNAEAVLEIRKEFGSFSDYVWSFTGGKTANRNAEEIAGFLSKDLKKRGLKFVGPGNTYSFMQAVGMVNGHAANCAFKKIKY